MKKMNTTINPQESNAVAAPTDSLQSNLEVSVQYAVEELDSEEPPSSKAISAWAQTAYRAAVSCSEQNVAQQNSKAIELSIRLVDEPEMTELNHAYRDKSYPTNVLSFPAELPPELVEELDLELLGDIVICHQVIVHEAKQQQKTVLDHYAHMVTHGVLHLCGYDHEEDLSADQMENLETEILAASGISDPYY